MALVLAAQPWEPPPTTSRNPKSMENRRFILSPASKC
jgi:hypothetical protein